MDKIGALIGNRGSGRRPRDRGGRLAAVAVLACCAAVAAACDRRQEPSQTKRAPVAAPAAPAAAPVEGTLPSPPKALGKPREPKDNPTTVEKVALGRQLFFDKRLSEDGTLACYSCHLNEDGTGGHDPIAVGPRGKKLTRHAPVLWNVAYLPRLYWDGRADSLEAVSRGALAGGNMGVGEENLDAKAKEIEAIAGYKERFDAVFPGEGVTVDTVTRALATYQRTLFCGGTAWDRFDSGDASALTDAQKAGWKLFTGKAACNQCHTPPFFSDAYTVEQGVYHNAGVGIEGRKKDEVDPGRARVTENPSDWAAFKTPSLRNVSKSPPYFHDGSAATLEQAVRFMAGGGFPNENLDSRFIDRKLTDEEVSQLVAFLEALTCDGTLEEPAELP
jgi:cytochrome c peroxidase